MEARRARGLDEVAHEVIAAGTPFIGICIGMQMLFEGSEERPGVPGSGVLHGPCRLLPADVQRPPMQWTLMERPGDPELLMLAQAPAGAYFVHLYAVTPDVAIVNAPELGRKQVRGRGWQVG